MKLKKGDNVVVISGNDKGKKGEILQTLPKTDKVIVKGINVRKKHMKPKKQGEQGGIIPIEMALSACKVNVFCGKCGKPTRIKMNIEKEEKIRVCAKCGTNIK